MSNRLDKRKYGVHQIVPHLQRILNRIQAKLSGVHFSQATDAGKHTIRYRSGFKTDIAIPFHTAKQNSFIFIGRFKQGGGYRILIPATNGSKTPTHVLSIKTGDEESPHLWTIQRGPANGDRQLLALLNQFNNVSRLNGPETPPPLQVQAIAATIVHALLPDETAKFAPATPATRITSEGSSTPTRPIFASEQAGKKKSCGFGNG